MTKSVNNTSNSSVAPAAAAVGAAAVGGGGFLGHCQPPVHYSHPSYGESIYMDMDKEWLAVVVCSGQLRLCNSLCMHACMRVCHLFIYTSSPSSHAAATTIFPYSHFCKNKQWQ